jgi:uncharacterized protein YgbK (DUF1537 family)
LGGGARISADSINADLAVDAPAWRSETERAAQQALRVLSEGGSPIIYTARGADDPAIAAFKTAVDASGLDSTEVNARVGDGLGRSLDTVVRTAGVNRAVIAGGDTSSHGALALGIYALTALAPTVPERPSSRPTPKTRRSAGWSWR